MDLVIPKHVAIVPDGNRRWALKNKKKPWEGHRYGVEKLEEVLRACLEAGVKQVSFWALSTENFKSRSSRELREIFNLAREYAKRFNDEDSELYKTVNKYEVKVRILGDLKRLPRDLMKMFKIIMQKTAKFTKRVLNVLINYGGRFELKEALKKLLKVKKSKITEDDIRRNLLVSDDVDLVIRTGGMHRLSNLMSWQTAYSEIYVTSVLWPDFNKGELMKAIRWFSKAKRNFGK